MKVIDLKTWIVGNPPPQYGGRYFIFVKLTTSNGISGVGEVYSATFSPNVIVAMIEDIFSRHVEGMDPCRVEDLWRQVYSAGFTMRPDTSVMGVLSGLETALWDIQGKAAEKPVFELLGGLCHPRMRTYSYLYPNPEKGGAHDDASKDFYFDPDASAQRALNYVAQGFTALKFDPMDLYSAYDPRQPSVEELDRAEAFCRRIREAVGDQADLLFGTHGQFTASGAVRLARRIEAYDPLWFEEPTPPDMPESMAEVARKTTIPIATGERLTTKYEFARVLQTGAASILQMAIGRVGGIWEAKKIASMAETYYAQIAPHLYCGPIEGAANAAVAFSSPNALIVESIERWDGFTQKILSKSLVWEDGFLLPSTEPGLGVELDEAVADAHPWHGTELHLIPSSKSPMAE